MVYFFDDFESGISWEKIKHERKKKEKKFKKKRKISELQREKKRKKSKRKKIVICSNYLYESCPRKIQRKKKYQVWKKNEFKVCLFTQVIHCHIFMSEIVSVGIVYYDWSIFCGFLLE